MTKETIGKYRWTICALLFLATTINYLDRQVLSLLQPTLEELFGWTNTDYANIASVFQFTYAICMLFAGRVVDKMGTRRGYSLAITVWSIGAILHAFAISIGGLVGGVLGLSGITAISIAGFMVGRAVLALGEAGNFPAAIKATAEYFPKKERSFATGIFNSGAGIGAILAPITIPRIYAMWGWEAAFIIVGAIGFVWLGLWLWLFKKPEEQPLLSAAELAYIRSDPEKPADTEESLVRDKQKVSWIKLLGYRQTWAFTFGKFMTDGVWWFFLFWLPAYLKAQYGVVGDGVMIPLAVLYMITMIGSIGGGWFPVYFAKKGYNIYEGRMRAMLTIAVIPLVVLLAQPLGGYSMWVPVILIGIGAAAHQAWSANIFTTVSDMFPQKAIGSVVGIGGMAGGIGGVLITKLGGWLFDAYRASGIAQGWAQAKATGLEAYISTIRSMNVTSKYGDRINLDKVDFSSVGGDALEKFRSVDPASFDKLLAIQKPLVLAEMTTSYTIMFAICAVAYLIAWSVMKLLVPKMKLVNI